MVRKQLVTRGLSSAGLGLANLLSLVSYKIVSRKILVGGALKTSNSDSDLESFGIVIVTFEARQFTRAIPLLKQIRLSGVTEPIALVVNGNFDATFDAKLRHELYLTLATVPNVFPIFIRRFHGLSHNWNLGIRLLGCKTTLVLNDDLWVDISNFKAELNRILSDSAASSFATINRSFSHFVIRDSALKLIGWFDERFVGIGEEDGDYYLRYSRCFSEPPLDFHTNSIVHFNDSDSGAERKGVSKYSLANLVYSRLKYSNPVSGDPGIFGECRTPNFDPAYRLEPEDFRRELGSWKDLNETDFIDRLLNSLTISKPKFNSTDSRHLEEGK